MRSNPYILFATAAIAMHMGVLSMNWRQTSMQVPFDAGEVAVELHMLPTVQQVAAAPPAQQSEMAEPAEDNNTEPIQQPIKKPAEQMPATEPIEPVVGSVLPSALTADEPMPWEVQTAKPDVAAPEETPVAEEPELKPDVPEAPQEPQAEMPATTDQQIAESPSDETNRSQPTKASESANADPRPTGTTCEVTVAYLHTPKYPWLSRRRGEQGTVHVEVCVLANGKLTDAKVVQSSGHPRLDKAAIEACKKCRFIPAQQGGVAVTSSKIVPFIFRLK